MFSMFTAGALLTHGRLTGRTVKLHDLSEKEKVEVRLKYGG